MPRSSFAWCAGVSEMVDRLPRWRILGNERFRSGSLQVRLNLRLPRSPSSSSAAPIGSGRADAGASSCPTTSSAIRPRSTSAESELAVRAALQGRRVVTRIRRQPPRFEDLGQSLGSSTSCLSPRRRAVELCPLVVSSSVVVRSRCCPDTHCWIDRQNVDSGRFCIVTKRCQWRCNFIAEIPFLSRIISVDGLKPPENP